MATKPEAAEIRSQAADMNDELPISGGVVTYPPGVVTYPPDAKAYILEHEREELTRLFARLSAAHRNLAEVDMMMAKLEETKRKAREAVTFNNAALQERVTDLCKKHNQPPTAAIEIETGLFLNGQVHGR